ncbi:g7119 [Coccomyxa viridis]|uniref:G7119 protein n=1 Tax=Coccomyxa viridis TaxID=1274662 RepID=A0ABP1FZL3_9CHLO
MPDPLRDVLQALESAPPPKVERVHDSMSKPFHDFAKEAEKLSPLAVMSEQTKEQIKNAFKSNWRKIVRCFLEASIYCALYHHATEALKTRTKKRRRLNRVLTYLFDIALPAPIYAPLFGFLLRLASPI